MSRRRSGFWYVRVSAVAVVLAAVVLSPGSAFRSHEIGSDAVRSGPAETADLAETAARGRHVVVYDPSSVPMSEKLFPTPQERAVGFTDLVTQLAEYDAWVVNGGDEATYRVINLEHPCVVVMATGRVHAAIERLIERFAHATPAEGEVWEYPSRLTPSRPDVRWPTTVHRSLTAIDEDRARTRLRLSQSSS